MDVGVSVGVGVAVEVTVGVAVLVRLIQRIGLDYIVKLPRTNQNFR